jgi:hypothetical protein
VSRTFRLWVGDARKRLKKKKKKKKKKKNEVVRWGEIKLFTFVLKHENRVKRGACPN